MTLNSVSINYHKMAALLILATLNPAIHYFNLGVEWVGVTSNKILTLYQGTCIKDTWTKPNWGSI